VTTVLLIVIAGVWPDSKGFSDEGMEPSLIQPNGKECAKMELLIIRLNVIGDCAFLYITLQLLLFSLYFFSLIWRIYNHISHKHQPILVHIYRYIGIFFTGTANKEFAFC